MNLKNWLKLTLTSIIWGATIMLKAAFPQHVTLRLGNVPLKTALEEITKQTGIFLIYNNEEINVNTGVFSTMPQTDVLLAINHLIGPGFALQKLDTNRIIISPTNKKVPVEHKNPQQQTIEGKVVDDAGVALPNVTVSVEGRSGAVQTDPDGFFQIKASIGEKIVMRMLGYDTKTLTITDASPKTVVLIQNASDISEVVVTGYAVEDRRQLTGAVVTLDRDKIPDRSPTTIDKMLQGRVPGMAITMNSGEPGAVPNVKIRGTSTLTGNTMPLWVIDGIILENPVPLTPTELNTPDVVNRIGNVLTNINPEDIESITVLKDASATAIYGVKAAGGVVVLTTKRGNVGKPVFNFRTNLEMVAKPTYNRFDVMNSKDRIDIEKYYFEQGVAYYNADADEYSVGLAGAYARYKSRDIADWAGYEQAVRDAQTINTNWFDILFRNGITTNNTLNISGGDKNTTYYTSLSYLDQQGADKFTDLNRYTGLIKLNTLIANKLKTQLSLSGNSSVRGSYPLSLVPGSLTNFARSTPRPFDYALQTSRTFPVYDSNGDYYFYKGHDDFYLFNILNEYDNSDQETKMNGFNGTANLDMPILPNLEIGAVLNYSRSNSLQETYYKENTNQIASVRRSEFGITPPADSYLPTGGVIFSRSDFQQTTMARFTADYRPIDTEEQELRLYLGGEYRANTYRGDNTSGWGYLHDRGRIVSTPQNMAEAFASTPYLVISDYNRKYASYFGMINYAYRDRYIVKLNARYDGSNMFGSNPEYRWKPTWSVSGRWNLSEENFLMEKTAVNLLALRASYGIQGAVNETSSPQLIAEFLPPGSWSDLNQLGITQPANPDLRWEKTYDLNLGIDFAFFGNRLNGAVDYYRRVSKDLITNTRISEVNGFSTLAINFADVTNNGIDFGISGDLIRKDAFTWTMGVNLSYNKNEVTKVNTDPNATRLLSNFPYKPDAALVGRPLNSIYSTKFAYLDDAGTARFLLANGDTTSLRSGLQFNVEDLAYSGPMEAVYTGGINQMFRYKNWRFNMLFTYGMGNYVRMQPLAQGWMYAPDQNLHNDLRHAWKYAGDEQYTNIPNINTLIGSNTHKDFWNQSDIRTMRGDFVRLKSVSVQYQLPESILKTVRLSNAFLQLEGSNLWLLADKGFSGFDPETYSYSSLPNLPTYLFSVNITF